MHKTLKERSNFGTEQSVYTFSFLFLLTQC